VRAPAGHAPGGRLVLIVPDRTDTFDAGRQPTPVDHVPRDFERHVTEVDDDHIREFCAALFNQPTVHPDEVRQWHDRSRLDAQCMALQRRCSIHVHCWTPEEFATVIGAGLARSIMSETLCDLYFSDDPGGQPDNEFGLCSSTRRRTSIPRHAARRSSVPGLAASWDVPIGFRAG